MIFPPKIIVLIILSKNKCVGRRYIKYRVIYNLLVNVYQTIYDIIFLLQIYYIYIKIIYLLEKEGWKIYNKSDTQ